MNINGTNVTDKPWEDEPDHLLTEHLGYVLEIKRHDVFKHLCGYIYLPETHPDYGKKYGALSDMDVHGGLTFSQNGCFGFDCAHAGDFEPGNGFQDEGNVYRTVDFVLEELHKLAEQFDRRK